MREILKQLDNDKIQKAFNSLIDFIQKYEHDTLALIASKAGISDHTAISKLKASEEIKTSTQKNNAKEKRIEFILKITIAYNIDVKHNNEGFIEYNLATHFFIFYYLKENLTIQKEAVIARKEGQEYKADLILYRADSNSVKERANYKGKTVLIDDQYLLLIFNTRKNLNSITEKEKEYWALCSFPSGLEGLDNDLLIGTFAGTKAFCGIVILERVNNLADLENNLKSKEISPVISNILWNSRISIDKRIRHLKDTPTAKMLDEVSQYEGRYEAYLLENRKERESIHKLVFEIKQDGTVQFSSAITGIQYGRIKSYLNGNLVIQFQDKKPSRYSHLQMILYVQFVKQPYFIGVYSGIDHFNRPMGGRMLFFSTEKKFEDIEPTQVDLKDYEGLQQLLEQRPMIRSFFRGEEDDYLDRPSIIENHPLLAGNVSVQVGNRVAGKYMFYHFNTTQENKDCIVAYPLVINPDSSVVLIGEGENESYCYYGKAIIFSGTLLSIVFEARSIEGSKDSEFFHSSLLFSIGAIPGREVSCFHGVFSFATKKHNSPACGRGILRVVSSEIENLKSIKIDLPSSNTTQEDAIIRDITKYLHGPTGNIISVRQSPDAPLKKEEDHALTYFTSACYFASKGNITNAKQQLKKAFQHGFEDKELLKQELEQGALQQAELAEHIDVENLLWKE